MNFMKLSMEYPEIFRVVDEKMEKLKEIIERNTEEKYKEREQNSPYFLPPYKKTSIFHTIAGGAPSNLYMNRPIRDIDVFIAYQTPTLDEVKEAFQTDVEMFTFKENIDYHGFVDSPYLFKTTIDGYDIEIIPCSIPKIFEFDVRFRQFYCYKGSIYATKEAIKDIKEKKIVITNPVTPTSSLFRLIRFSELFDFTIDPKSEQFVKWAFQHLPKSKEKFIEYGLSRKHKISEKGLNTFLSYAENNTRISKKYFFDKESDKWKMKYSEDMYFKDAKFPFHPSLEKAVERELNNANKYWRGKLSMCYNHLSTFKPFKKSFMLDLDINLLEEKTKILISEIKKNRMRYVAKGLPINIPFPKVSDWKSYLKNNFLRPLANQIFDKKTFEGEMVRFFTAGIDLLPKRVKIDVVSVEESMPSFINNDFLSHSSLKLIVNEKMCYLLRKCTNGKYTIADIFNKNTSFGEGFYLELIGKSLKEQYPDWFDFNNPHLKAIYHYDYHACLPKDFYFEQCEFHKNPLEEIDGFKAVSMDKTNLKHIGLLKQKSS